MDTLTITVSRELAATILDALNIRRISASAHRNPHFVAQREAAEAAAVLAEAQYHEYLDAVEEALPVVDVVGHRDTDSAASSRSVVDGWE